MKNAHIKNAKPTILNIKLVNIPVSFIIKRSVFAFQKVINDLGDSYLMHPLRK